MKLFSRIIFLTFSLSTFISPSMADIFPLPENQHDMDVYKFWELYPSEYNSEKLLRIPVPKEAQNLSPKEILANNPYGYTLYKDLPKVADKYADDGYCSESLLLTRFYFELLSENMIHHDSVFRKRELFNETFTDCVFPIIEELPNLEDRKRLFHFIYDYTYKGKNQFWGESYTFLRGEDLEEASFEFLIRQIQSYGINNGYL